MDIKETLRAARLALVGVNKAQIVLNRKGTILNSVGGYSDTTIPLPAQWVRIARPSFAMKLPEEQSISGGNAANVSWIILFQDENPDCLVGDTFEHPGTHSICEIKGVDDYYVSPGDAKLFVRALATEVR